MTEEVRKRYMVACRVLMSMVNVHKISDQKAFELAVTKALILPSVGEGIWAGNREAVAEITERENVTVAEVMPALMLHCEWRGSTMRLKTIDSAYVRFDDLPEADRDQVRNHHRDHPGHILFVMRCAKNAHFFAVPGPAEVSSVLKSCRAAPEDRAQEID